MTGGEKGNFQNSENISGSVEATSLSKGVQLTQTTVLHCSLHAQTCKSKSDMDKDETSLAG